ASVYSSLLERLLFTRRYRSCNSLANKWVATDRKRLDYGNKLRHPLLLEQDVPNDVELHSVVFLHRHFIDRPSKLRLSDCLAVEFAAFPAHRKHRCARIPVYQSYSMHGFIVEVRQPLARFLDCRDCNFVGKD